MDVPAGRAVEPREFEEQTSRWAAAGGSRFASLGSALICTVLEAAGALPRIGGRIFARDGGIDGEADLGPLTLVAPCPLARPGRNVYQYKCRDVLGADRKKILSSLGGKLEGEWNRLARSPKGPPDHYYLLVNLNLTGPEETGLRDAILKGADRSAEGLVTILPAGLLTGLLSSRPALLAGFFWSDTWIDFEEFRREHERRAPLPAFVGHHEERAGVQSFLEDPEARVLRILGPSQSGKTRLVLEALQVSGHRVVAAVDPAASTGELLKLDQQPGTIVILDSPPSDRVEAWVEAATARENLKLVVTSDLPRGAPPPIPASRRVRVLQVGPLGTGEADRLLRHSHPSLDLNYRAWILEEFGRLPGLMLLAADLEPGTRRGQRQPLRDLAERLSRRAEVELGEGAVAALRTLSLLQTVEDQDLKVLARVAGGPSEAEIKAWIGGLRGAGHLQNTVGGVRISVGILANHLAGEAFRSDPALIVRLIAALDDRQGARLLARVAEIGDEGFWHELFAPGGPLASWESLEASPELLGHASRGAPGATLGWLREHLVTMSREQRKEMQGAARRAVVSALDTLLFHAETSAPALELLGLLGAAETETYGNSASELFVEAMEPRHPQLPLPLSKRMEIAKKLRARSEEPGLGQRVLHAAGQILRFQRPPRYLRPSPGWLPLDAPFRPTEAEEHQYLLWLLDLLLEEARGNALSLGLEALQWLPESVLGAYRRGVPLENLAEVLQQLEQWGRAAVPGLSLHRLVQVLEELGLGERAETLKEANFATRLEAVAGSWGLYDPGEERDRFEASLDALASEAVTPGALTPQLQDWLLSAEAPCGPRLLQALGRADAEKHWLGPLQDAVLRARFGWDGLGGYLMGLAEHSLETVRLTVLEGMRSGGWPELGAVHVISLLGPSSGLLDALADLRDPLARMHGAEVFSRDAWVRDLEDPDFHRLLSCLAGPDLDCPDAVVKLAGARCRHKGPLAESSALLAARCLALGRPRDSRVDNWHYDSLLAALGVQSPDLALSVLAELLQHPRRCLPWHPLDRHQDRPKNPSAWRVLYEQGPDRAVSIALEAAVADEVESGVFIPWHLKGRIDLALSGTFLLDFASRGRAHARVVASLLGPEQPGFWDLVDQLVQSNPEDDALRSALAGILAEWSPDSAGPEQHEKSVARKLEQVMNQRDFSPPTEIWLRRFIRDLRHLAPVPVLWDSSMADDEFRAVLANPSSPHRRWAVSRVLKEAPLKDLRRLLTVQDIQQALPEVELPPRRRKALEGALEVWTADAWNPDTASA